MSRNSRILSCASLLVLFTFGFSAPAPPPCKTGNGTSCGIHVFRVALSSRPEEEGGLVAVKPRKKYGSNVYAPRGSADSFNINLVREVVDNMPRHLDPRVKDRVNDADFVMKPVEGSTAIWLGENDVIPTNFQPFLNPPTTKPPPPPPPPREAGFPYFFIFLLVVVGIILGVILSIGIYFLYTSSRKTVIDRSNVVIYRRPTEIERVYLEQQRKAMAEAIERKRRRGNMSSAQSNASSRAPRPPPPLRRPLRVETRAVEVTTPLSRKTSY